jgi:hypothetical protein
MYRIPDCIAPGSDLCSNGGLPDEPRVGGSSTWTKKRFPVICGPCLSASIVGDGSATGCWRWKGHDVGTIETSRRRVDLTFSHHVEVMAWQQMGVDCYGWGLTGDELE